jgi:enoyl-CoA hydratase
MAYQNILTENREGIFFITINRPDKLNALNAQTLTEIEDAVKTVYNDSAIKTAIITGSGPKAFVAGADISGFQGMNKTTGSALAGRGQDIFFLIENCPKPIVAAINGFALGGGCELAMSCHFRLASENAKFGQPEVNLGLIPGYGGTQRLIQHVGKGKATELMMTADMIGAQEALQLGLVNYVTSSDDLLPKTIELLKKIMSKSPFAISKIITTVNKYFEPGKGGFQFEADEFGACCETEDFKEGTSAFLEKRKANFTGK